MYTGDLQNLYIFIETELLKLLAVGTLIFLERFEFCSLLCVGKKIKLTPAYNKTVGALYLFLFVSIWECLLHRSVLFVCDRGLMGFSSGLSFFLNLPPQFPFVNLNIEDEFLQTWPFNQVLF